MEGINHMNSSGNAVHGNQWYITLLNIGDDSRSC